MKSFLRALVLGVVGSFCLPRVAPAGIPDAPAFGANYHLAFGQDFTAMTNLSQLKVSSKDMGDGVWIAHTPLNQDWFTFQDPSAPGHPFNVGNGYLTIRVQKDGHDPHNWFAGYSGGLLSSVDQKGIGFAQQYGYFECSMQCPGTPNTWPAFWLMSAGGIMDHSLNSAEIDVTESYGNWGTGPGFKPSGNPNFNTYTWHVWKNRGDQISWGASRNDQPGMTTGFHQYGVDVEPTGITWYFDRKKLWDAPIFPEAKTPLFVMVNLALGGGNHNNANGSDYDWTLTPNPTDLKVQYIAVWASPNSPNYAAVKK
jgi:beta-glucanase (GH16 family)